MDAMYYATSEHFVEQLIKCYDILSKVCPYRFKPSNFDIFIFNLCGINFCFHVDMLHDNFLSVYHEHDMSTFFNISNLHQSTLLP